MLEREVESLGDTLLLWAQPLKDPPSGRVRVTALEPDQSPWAGAEVLAQLSDRVEVGRTDERGVCEFAGLGVGIHRFWIPSQEWTERGWGEHLLATVCSTLLSREGELVTVSLGAAPSSSSLLVEVAGPSGEREGGRLVSLYGSVPPVRSAESDATGRAQFSDLPIGVYRVAVQGGTLWEWNRTIEVKPGPPARERLTLGAGVVRGRVKGLCRAGVVTILSLVAGDRQAGMGLGREGEFEFSEVPPGRHRLCLVAYPTGTCHLPVEVDVSEENSGAVELDLGEVGMVRAMAKTPSGKPIARLQVSCSLAGKGSFALDPIATGMREAEFLGVLPAGSQLLVAEAPGGWRGSASVQVVPERIVTVEVEVKEAGAIRSAGGGGDERKTAGQGRPRAGEGRRRR